MKSTKKSLVLSALSLVLCVAMLLGTTYAWFTDSVTSGKNRIVAGNLDVELKHYTTDADAAVTVKDSTDLFGVAKWEPGVIAYENLVVSNEGNLAFKYNLTLNVNDYNSVYVGTVEHDLREVLKVYVSDEAFEGDRAAAQALTYAGTLGEFSRNGYLLTNGATKTYAVVIYWEPGNNDNIYNINNDKEVETSIKGVSKDDADNSLFVEFGINLFATQYTYEEDSFDDQYDFMPEIWSEVNAFGNINKATAAGEGDILVKDESENSENLVSAVIPGVPFGAIEKSALMYKEDKDAIEWTIPDVTDGHDEEIALKVKPEAISETSATYDITLRNITQNCQIEKINKVMEVKMKVGTGLADVKVNHSGEPMTNSTSKENQTYSYDYNTGIVTIYTDTFSPFEILWKYGAPMAYVSEIDSLPQNIDFFDFTNKFGTTKENDVVTPAPLQAAYTFKAFETQEDEDAIADLVSALGITNDNQLGNLTTEAIDEALAQVEDEELRARLSTILNSRKEYLSWRADFTVSFDRDVAHNTIGLAGQYDNYDSNSWLGFGLPKDVAANTEERLLADAYEAWHADVFKMSYASICGWVKTFNCGIVNFSEDNIGTTATVSLYLYKVDDNGDETGESIKVCSIPFVFTEAYTGE